ncbi:TetR/AcrR family transcriptional regulator [Actinomadura scrupuli]|uniref:TetR/AcrR family transcriptional regulator n=1 Tax=Actinomadura scrupuli TaxID=559629 RepID=UPI003D96DA11
MGVARRQAPDSELGIAQEQIMESATRLFASLGYDGTSNEMIADAAGLDLATVERLAGTKRDIYLAVVARFHRIATAMFDSAFAEFTPDRAGVLMLADRYLDYCVDHPEVPALWTHRWQSDAADITEVERLYFMPLFDRCVERIQTSLDGDVDVEYALWTLTWCIHGFCMGSVLNSRGEREGPDNTAFLRRFRRHLHKLVGQVFELSR